MGYEAKKTEHCGPKRGNGAYWGYRWDASAARTPNARSAMISSSLARKSPAQCAPNRTNAERPPNKTRTEAGQNLDKGRTAAPPHRAPRT